MHNDEQMLFRRLAVFAGGWTGAAVESVSGGDDSLPRDVMDGLQSLLDLSLIQRMGSADGEPRFTMLETIREYAVDCLVTSGERERVEQHHATYFLALAEAAAADLQGPQQLAWLARLEVEHDNLRAVLAWSTREQDPSAGRRRATGLRLADALYTFWERRGHLTEGRAWLDRLLFQVERDDAAGPAPVEELVVNAVSATARLAYMHGDLPAACRLYDRSLVWHTEHQNPRGRAVALVGLGHIAAAYDDLLGARMRYQEALTLRRELDDSRGVSSVVFSLGHIAMSLGDLDEAVARFAEATALDHELGDTAGLALDYDAAGQLAFLQGRYDEASAQTETALALYRKLGDTARVAEALDVLGWLAVQRGEYSRAATLLVKAIALARDVDGNKTVLAWPLCRLGIVATRQQDAVRAGGLLRESLALFTACEPPETAGISLCLLGFASVAGAQQAPEQSACLVGAAAALHEAGNQWCRGFAQREIERTMAEARARLDEVAWAAAWSAGRAMTVEQAVVEALSVTT